MVRLVATLAYGTLLLIEETPEGVFLYQNVLNGPVYDTWHQTIDEAKQQATFQFEVPAGAWAVVPAEIADSIKFARKIPN
jgi:hypothetical protein